jgi:hypothetical protein
MHVVTWDDKAEPILQCDGRELALLELEAAQEAQAEAEASAVRKRHT